MDTKAEGPRIQMTVASSLLVVVVRGPRSEPAAQPALLFFLATRLASTSCLLYL